MTVKPIPDGYHSVTPYLIVRDCAAAIEFYARAFDAVETLRLTTPDGKIGHAEIRIGNSQIMLADEFPDRDIQGPHAIGGSPVSFLIYVPDVDHAFPQALAAGAIQVSPIEDQFYGDRSGRLRDPFGYSWNIATHKEDLSSDEIERRMKSAQGG